jgi:putative aldouronate transport system permease protein
MSNKFSKIGILAHIVFILLVILCIFPFALLIVASFTDDQTILNYGYSLFPRKWSLSAYQYLFSSGAYIFHAYLITIIVTVVGTTVSLFITAALGYVISRKDLPGRVPLSFIVFFTILFNGGLVPTYLVYTQMFHLKDTIFALLIPGLLMNGFNVLMMRTYFQVNIPTAIIESAMIDGSSELKTFYKIILPLSTPILATIGLFTGLSYWNDWNNGLIYITNKDVMSLQTVLNRILLDIQYLTTSTSMTNVDTSKIPTSTVRMAIAVIGVIPVLIVYPFFQKYFEKGLTIGSVKG